ncbi:hydrogenase-4, component A [Campylobacter iguaniorum]|uniref:Hydrogenase-4, component A n=1 Tax=Campylobacter iguaniorum TaxID=1244531 RepID=A0A076FDW6_9BACT|nr:4Fe-4S dicluster domain-containing protein [Campylobacter iguaniorum]AII14024.1 hydrogenase-4, component A [Campylobacter iguaniorum]
MSKKHKFVICNPELCIGCKACMKACSKEAYKRGKLAKPRLQVIKLENGVMPNQCRQCEDAPCAVVCPTSALRNENGFVEVHERLCIGCGLCTNACPYGAIHLDSADISSTGASKDEMDVCGDGFMSVAIKCDICDGRDGGSACVEVCPKGALVMLDPLSNEHKFGKKLKDGQNMSNFIAKILECEPPLITIEAKKPKETVEQGEQNA